MATSEAAIGSFFLLARLADQAHNAVMDLSLISQNVVLQSFSGTGTSCGSTRILWVQRQTCLSSV